MSAETEKFCSSKLTLFMNTVCVALIAGQKNFLQVLTQWAARCHSWYSNLLWAGRSRNQIPVRARFSLLSRLAPRSTQHSVQWILVLSRGAPISFKCLVVSGYKLHLHLPLCCHRHVIRWPLPLPLPNTMPLLYEFSTIMISNAAHALS